MSIWRSISLALGMSRAPESMASPPASQEMTGEVIPTQALWSQFGRIGGDLTPAALSNIFREADGGRIRRFVDLIHEVRQKDGHIHGCLTTLELDIAALEWASVPAKRNGKSKRNDDKLARQVDLAMSEIDNWQEMVSHLTGEGEQFGHGTSEIVWKIYDGDESILRGWIVPDRAVNVQTNRFGFASANGSLLFDANGNGEVNVGGQDLLLEYAPGKFVQHKPRVNGDVRVREGVGRFLGWAGVFRNWGMKDWLLAAEDGWKPIRIGTYKKGADSKDIQLIKDIVRRLTSSGGVAKPETVDLQVEFPKNASGQAASPHSVLLNWFADEISKATLGHTLLMQQGDSGARSLGEVGERTSMRRRDARALSLAATINAQLIRPLVRMNTTARRIPLYLPNIKSAIDLEKFSKAVDLLASRMEIPASWVREQASIPEELEGEDCLLMGKQPVDPDAPVPEKPTAPGAPASGKEKPEAGDTEEPSD